MRRGVAREKLPASRPTSLAVTGRGRNIGTGGLWTAVIRLATKLGFAFGFRAGPATDHCATPNLTWIAPAFVAVFPPALWPLALFADS